MHLVKISLIRIHNMLKKSKVRLLWRSQCKEFYRIGEGSSVVNLPYVTGADHIVIGERFFCGADVRIEAWDRYGERTFFPKVIIGNDVKMTDRCYLSCIDQIEIGDGVLLGRDVFITDNSHGRTDKEELLIPPVDRELTSKGPVKIGKNVWVGRQVTIVSGVTVGEGAIIGANSFVNKDVPPFSVVAGNPAYVIREL